MIIRINPNSNESINKVADQLNTTYATIRARMYFLIQNKTIYLEWNDDEINLLKFHKKSGLNNLKRLFNKPDEDIEDMLNQI